MKMLRLKQVLERVPVGKSTIWKWVREDKFPAPIRLSARCTVWLEEDIQKFMDNRW